MAARYRYVSCHPVLRNQLDPSLRLIDAEWSWVVGGNGTLSAKITVPESATQIEQLRTATAPKQAAIYVRNSDGLYPWGGVVTKRKWSRANNEITISVMEWRAWFYNIIMGPGTTSDITYGLTSSDQLVISRDLVGDALAGGTSAGIPIVMANGALMSGKTRDLTFFGSQMKTLGQQIDTIANRDGGFEWSIEIRPSSTDGLPELWFSPYFPERGSQAPGVQFRATEGGHGNFIPGDYEEDMSHQYDRFWTTGAGQAPDATWALDVDPELVTGNKLRFDGHASFSTVSEWSTLASHARRARKFYAPGVNLVTGTVPFARVNPDVYHIGDRVRYRVKDRWTDLDLPAVRIVEKKMTTSGAGHATVTLDLTDFTYPEVDTGGGV